MTTVALFALALSGISTARGAADGDCPTWGEPAAQDALPDELPELSGLAVSSTTGITWAHNDSGGDDTLVALDPNGGLLGEVTVRDADNADWEDLAIGPCAEQGCSCLYIADIGDQQGDRQGVTLYRVAEPADRDDLPKKTEAAEALVFSYPDGAHDAEALAMHPTSGELLIITKVDSGPATVFAGQLDETALQELGELDLAAWGAEDARVTGAAVSVGGLRLAVRTETQIFVWTVGDGTLAEALKGEPEVIDAPDDEGEAVSFTEDGQALLVAGEGGGSLWTIPCAVFADEVAVDAAVPCPADGCGCASGPGRAPWGMLATLMAAIYARRRPTTSGSPPAARRRTAPPPTASPAGTSSRRPRT